MRDITLCYPKLQVLAKRLLDECSRQGLKIKISETLRTVEEQDELYAQGRTKPGNIVTNARGSSYSSYHQWGTAFDFIRVDGKGAYYDNDGFFTKVGKIGVSLGLEWGGNWKSIPDKPHFQLPDWGSTTSGIKKLYATPEAFMKTWIPEQEPEGWVHDAAGWWYRNADGTWPKSTWKELKWNGTTSWYYFNSAGYMVSNEWRQDNGKWYYLGADGAMVKGCVLVIGNECFAIGIDGAMLTGEIQLQTNDRGALVIA